jgi:hypothetical protein
LFQLVNAHRFAFCGRGSKIEPTRRRYAFLVNCRTSKAFTRTIMTWTLRRSRFDAMQSNKLKIFKRARASRWEASPVTSPSVYLALKLVGCGEMTASLQLSQFRQLQPTARQSIAITDFPLFVCCINPYSYWEISCCIVPIGFYRYNHGWVDHPSATLSPGES